MRPLALVASVMFAVGLVATFLSGAVLAYDTGVAMTAWLKEHNWSAIQRTQLVFGVGVAILVVSGLILKRVADE